MQSLIWNAFPVSNYIFTAVLWALPLLRKGLLSQSFKTFCHFCGCLNVKDCLDGSIILFIIIKIKNELS